MTNSMVVFTTKRTKLGPARMVSSSGRNTTKGPIILKPASLPEDYEARIDAFFRFIDDIEAGLYMAEDATTEQ